MSVSARPSTLHIMALRDVRDANEKGSAVAVLDPSLELVLWANVAGCRLLGLAFGSWQAGPALLSSSFPTSRQIKSAARLLDQRGVARLLLRTGAGIGAKPVVADLRRLEEPGNGYVFLAVEALRPAQSDDGALARRLIEENGLVEAAIYDAAGQLTSGSVLGGAAPSTESIVAFIASGEARAILEAPGSRTSFARVASRLVLVTHEALENTEGGRETVADDASGPEAGSETDDADRLQTPSQAGLFSVRRRRLPNGRPPTNMSALVQRWHHRNDKTASDTPVQSAEATEAGAEGSFDASSATESDGATAAAGVSVGDDEVRISSTIDAAPQASADATDKAAALEHPFGQVEAPVASGLDDAEASVLTSIDPAPETVPPAEPLAAEPTPPSPQAMSAQLSGNTLSAALAGNEPKQPLRSLWGVPTAPAPAATAIALPESGAAMSADVPDADLGKLGNDSSRAADNFLPDNEAGRPEGSAATNVLSADASSMRRDTDAEAEAAAGAPAAPSDVASTGGDALPTPSEEAFIGGDETDQPQEKEAAVVFPDLPPEDAAGLDTPLSPDSEVPGEAPLAPGASEIMHSENPLDSRGGSEEEDAGPRDDPGEQATRGETSQMETTAAAADRDAETKNVVELPDPSDETPGMSVAPEASPATPDETTERPPRWTLIDDEAEDLAAREAIEASLGAPLTRMAARLDNIAPSAEQAISEEDGAREPESHDPARADGLAEAGAEVPRVDVSMEPTGTVSTAPDLESGPEDRSDAQDHPAANPDAEAGAEPPVLPAEESWNAAPPPPVAEFQSEQRPPESAEASEFATLHPLEPDAALIETGPIEAGVVAFEPQFDASPVRFVWQTDRDGRFSTLSPDFASTVGERAADVIGRSFKDVAQVFGFDGEGEIARLLDRRDTWSGRTILWPVENSNRKVAVDLAALPVYAADRTFDGFRGFGVLRMGDWVVDPDAVGLLLADIAVGGSAAGGEPASGASDDLATDDRQDLEPDQPANPGSPLLRTFAGDFPASSFGRRLEPPRGSPTQTPVVEAGLPAPGEANDDVLKVIKLEERRRPRDGALSQAEEAAFRAIGKKLGTPSEAESPGALRFADAPPLDDKAASEQPGVDAALEGGATSRIAERALSHDDAPSPIEDRPADFEAGEALEPGVETPPGPVDAADRQTPSSPVSTADVIADRSTLDDVLDVPAEHPLVACFDNAKSEAGAELLSDSVDTAPNGDADPDTEVAPSVVDLDAIFGSLPLPILVQAQESLIYANREFAEFTGYAELSALRESGGLDRLFAEAADGSDHGKVAIRRADGALLSAKVHIQRITLSDRSCLLMSFSTAVPAIPEAATVNDAGPSTAASPVVVPPSDEDRPEPLVDDVDTSIGDAPRDSDASDLRQQIEELQAVLDTATDGIVLLDPAGNIRGMNGSAHALFGIAHNDHQGRHLSSLFAHESQKATHDYLDMLRDDGMAGILNDGREVIGRVAQGGFIPLFITVGRLSDERGWCVVIRDIAHWKRIEEDLVNARRQAEAASLHKSRFLANISHELRTPLNAIIGFADVMASECFGPIGNERYLEYLGDIKRSGHHVLDLVNDLLDISKIEAGKLDLSFEAVSLNEVVSEVVSLMQPQANRERVIVRSNLPSSVPPVVADRRTIRQIALNLVANAIRFTPAGGQIIVSTTYTAEGAVVLRFRDSGIGMTEREIEIALTPFQQVHSPSVNRGEGTGLGLPLTKAMVEANRAAFAINSAPGEGTLIEISFPSQRVLAD